MAARDRFTILIRCPQCGNGGEAEVSEDDYPFMRSPRFSVDQVPPGIKVTRSASVRHETEVQCDCGQRFLL